MQSQPTVLQAETMPVSSHPDPAQQPSSQANPALSSPSESQHSPSPRHGLPPESRSAEEEPVAVSSGGFFGTLRKKMRSAAGIDSQFVNPYLGKDHSSGKLPPYGQQTSSSPAQPPTSSMMPPSFQPQQDYYQQQQAMMYGMPPPLPFANRMPMNPMGGKYYGGVPPQFHGPAPFLYPSSSLLDYAYNMHDPYGGGYPYGFNPYSAGTMPVQDKRLLPERNHYSAVKDIWSTNLN
ncbi:hypothetical protein BC941DRAFT_451163 [Chlamydoabsidia padenii]|nr:hypothetical protein BC941DRAFT_451163 [Chlamydoabsidia padenii]